MDVEETLNSLGAYGRYQKAISGIVGLISSFCVMLIYATIFTVAEPDIICTSKLADNSSLTNPICDLWSNYSNSKNESLPFECHFDTKYYGTTLLTEWNLVCDRLYLAGLTQTMFMVGSVSGFFSGILADRFGRKRICVITSVMMSITLVLSELLQLQCFGLSVSAKYGVYLAAQYSLGFSSYVLYVTAYVLLIEMNTSAYTTLVSNINLYMCVIGELFVLLIAYFSRDWHMINWIMAGYSVAITLLVIFVLPESPRFLITTKQFERAYHVFKRIAKLNGKVSFATDIKEFNEKLIDVKKQKINNNDGGGEENEKIFEQQEEDQQQVKETSQSKEIFTYLKEKKNLFITVSLIYTWTSLSLIYYGVSLGITSIGRFDPYIMYLLSSVSEIVGYALCHLNDRYSRKKVLIFFLFSASFMCLLVAVIPPTKLSEENHVVSLTVNSVFIIICASIGKVMASGAFNSSYIFTSLMFPTHLRSTLVLFVSSIGRIGSLISPQINLLRVLVWNPLPYIIFSASSLISCIFVFFLPDTSTMQ